MCGHRAVKQGKSRESVGTTDQWKGRGCGKVRVRQGGRGKARGGDGHRHLRRERVQGKGCGQWREANRHRPLQTAAHPGVMPKPPPPPKGRDALEGKGPQTRFQKRLGRCLEKISKAAGGGYCQ